MNDKPGSIHFVSHDELMHPQPKDPVPEFQGWPKIPRLMKDMVITEKIDGTNGQIFIEENGDIRAGSRKRWLTLTDDNHGFGEWVYSNKTELINILGPGRHFGEWWGQGINRRYDMEHKVFSLFNTSKWEGMDELGGQLRVVPVLATHTFDTDIIEMNMNILRSVGSSAAPGFMKPEGLCVFHTAANQIFKYPLED